MSGIGETGVVGQGECAFGGVLMAESESRPNQYAEVVHEEPGRHYDPKAVFSLDLDSDESDDE